VVISLFKMNPKDLKRMMKRMGINVEVEEIDDAERVIIERSGDYDTLIENPTVTIMKMKGQTIVQIIGEVKDVEKSKSEEESEIPEEDVELVAAETGVSLDEARAALVASKGDIAQAIMLLQSRRQ